MLCASISEVLSIGAIVPFLTVIVSPEMFFEHAKARPFIEFLEITNPADLLLPFTIIFAGAVLLSGFLRLSLLWTQTRIGHLIGADFSLKIYRQTLYQPFDFHVTRSSSEVISGITVKAHSVVGGTLIPVLTIISSFLILCTIIVALISIEPLVTLFLLGFFGSLYLMIGFYSRKKLTRLGQISNAETSVVIQSVQDSLGGMREVIIDGTQETFCKLYRESDLKLRLAFANIQIIAGFPRFIIEALGLAFIAFFAYAMAVYGNGLAAILPVLGAFALGAQRLLPMLQNLFNAWSTMRGAAAALEDVLIFLEKPPGILEQSDNNERIIFKKSIDLNFVDYRYSSSAALVLKGINLKIPKGSRVGIIGQTGSGKSTLADIILGLLHPSSGSLAVDGIMIDPANVKYWQACIAHVSQNIFLANTSVEENIAFGVPRKTIDRSLVQDAAKKAQIAETIESWPMGYETKTGDGGIQISGGQRQRIGLARAFYKRADVIVFDEATSALDKKTEDDVMCAIESLNSEVTLLIITHRISTLKDCDFIVELDKGKVIRLLSYPDLHDQK